MPTHPSKGCHSRAYETSIPPVPLSLASRLSVQSCAVALLAAALAAAMPKAAPAHARPHHSIPVVPAARAAPDIVIPADNSTPSRTRLTHRIRLQAVRRIHAMARLIMAANRTQRNGSQQSKRYFSRLTHNLLPAILPELHPQRQGRKSIAAPSTRP
jgi:hypothetical protein